MTLNYQQDLAREEFKKKIRATKYANIMLDWTFKKVFGQEQNKNVLISLLNSILPELKIVDLEYRTTEFLSKVAENKNFILDLRCKTAHDKEIIIEMQNSGQKAFFERCVGYGAYAYSNELEEGSLYDSTTPVYVVAIISEKAGKEMILHEPEYDNKVVYNYIFKEKETNEIANPSIMVTFVELSKFNKTEDECKTELDQWFYVLKNSERVYQLNPAFQTEVFKQVFKELDVATFTREERMRHFRENLAKYDDYMQKAFYREKGLEEGMAKGEEKSQREIAQKMKAKGIDPATIAECTGLSIEQVENL